MGTSRASKNLAMRAAKEWKILPPARIQPEVKKVESFMKKRMGTDRVIGYIRPVKPK